LLQVIRTDAEDKAKPEIGDFERRIGDLVCMARMAASDLEETLASHASFAKDFGQGVPSVVSISAETRERLTFASNDVLNRAIDLRRQMGFAPESVA
jgi:hypothetical protein